MSIALIITDRNVGQLVKELLNLNNSLDIQVWPDIKNPEQIELAVLWKQPQNYLAQFENLKAVTSLGAGTDFIESDSSLAEKTPIHKIVTSGLKQQMAQYVLSYILKDYRDHKVYENQQLQNNWQINELNENVTVGILGLGEIAEFVASQLINLGFNVVAWTKSQKHSQIKCFHQKEGLKKVLERSDYVVGLLPLNADTKGIINYESLKWFKKNSMLIQVGRGTQVVETDLITALDKSLLRKAVLDVFAIEPLPDSNPLWSHPKIRITPHNSARSDNIETAQKIYQLYQSIK